MGQYYIPVLRRKTSNRHYKDTLFDAHKFDNGLKLMEHSYIGNNFVNEVYFHLLHNPAKVYWLGDYSASGDAKLNIRTIKKLKTLFYDHKSFIVPFGSPELGQDFCIKFPYILNHTKKEYIDVREMRSSMDKIFDYTIHPLPLLTATSNGRGAGDYPESYPDYENIGAWAGDELEVTDNSAETEGYTRKIVNFISGIEDFPF